MKLLGIISLISAFGLFSAIPATGQGCCHHDHHCDDCWDCGHYSRQIHRRAGDSSPAPPLLQTMEGKIAEVVYLPGATADTGLVEIRLQSSGQSKLIRSRPRDS